MPSAVAENGWRDRPLAPSPADKPKPAPSPPAWLERVTPIAVEWCTTPPAPRDWLLRDERQPALDGFLPRGKVGALIAEGGAGKTMALTQLGITVSAGRPWLGSFSVEARGRAFLLLAEEDVEEARRRVYTAADGLSVPPDSLVVAPLHGVPCALLERDEHGGAVETPFAAQLRGYLAATGPWDLIALDPLSRLGGPDCETDNAVATRLVQVLESIAEQTRATVIVAHHTAKGARGGVAVTSAASRGSSALVDGVRWQASLSAARTEAGEVVTFCLTKTNYTAPETRVPLLLRRAFGGRLVPLSAAERAAVEDALSGDAARRERSAQREAEREAVQTRREAQDAAKRAEREAARERRAAEDADAVRAILERDPELSGRALRTAVRAALSCGADRADAAIVRAKAMQ
jgi:hypothetical protein